MDKHYKEMFPEILKDLRKNSQFNTLEKLAEQVGVTRQTIGFYEKGERIPDTETLVRLADIFGVSCDFLLGRSVVPSELGLSHKAMLQLELDATSGLSDDADYIKILSKLIEHDHFPTFCKVIENYIIEDGFIDDQAKSFLQEATSPFSVPRSNFFVESLYQKTAECYLWKMAKDMKNERKFGVAEIPFISIHDL